MGWGVERHGRGNPGEGLDLQERQGAIVGGVRGGGMDAIRNSLNWSVHMPVDSQRAEALWCRLWVARSLLLI